MTQSNSAPDAPNPTEVSFGGEGGRGVVGQGMGEEQEVVGGGGGGEGG